MSRTDLEARLAPWLQRWSLADMAGAEPWLSSMSLRQFGPEDYLVRAGDQCDTFTVDSAAPEGAAIHVSIVDPTGGGVTWLYSVRSTWTTASAQP